MESSEESSDYVKSSFGHLLRHLSISPRRSACTVDASFPTMEGILDLPSNNTKNTTAKTIWSPSKESSLQNLHDLKPGSDFPFALLLDNSPHVHRTRDQVAVIRRVLTAGLDPTILQSTLHTRDVLVLLLKPTARRLAVEQQRLVLERWLEIGGVGEAPTALASFMDGQVPDETHLTPAEQLQAIARIISTPPDEHRLYQGAGIAINESSNLNKDKIMIACFPLHDRVLNKMLQQFKGRDWSPEKIHELRYVMGEKVAYFFAFTVFYTKFLFAPSIVGILLYIVVRWSNAVAYMRALAIFGYVVAIVWGTLMIKYWERTNEKYKNEWNVKTFKEAQYPNARYTPTGYRNVVNAAGEILFREPYTSTTSRIVWYALTTLVWILFLMTYIGGISIFVQWYTTAMLAPLCSECPECTGLFSCFHSRSPTVFTWRWVYIFLQGVALGITLDVFVYLLSHKCMRFFVSRGQYYTEASMERAIINRLFAINWISFFLWFLLVAFLVTPFGAELESWLNVHFNYSKLSVDWVNGRIDMSTALVTPLLITQGLNLFIDTALPYFWRKEKLRTARLARHFRARPSDTLRAMSNIDANRMSAKKEPRARQLSYKERVELQMQTPLHIDELETELGVTIPVISSFENDGDRTADDIVEESRLEVYDSFTDYLKMVIQFGFVIMFTVVWPFCPFAATCNNYVHLSNCLFKVCVHRRRVVPRKANSIGHWENMLNVTLLLGLFVIVGLIVLSSGQLEFFIPNCLALERFQGRDYSMTPDMSCLSVSHRAIAALGLEHIALILVYVLKHAISATPEDVKISDFRKKAWVKRAIEDHARRSQLPQPSTFLRRRSRSAYV